MPRFKVTLEYAGTRYSGWQKQKNARTVQGEVERAIAEATGQRTFDFQGSGRTDAGVHALHQVAHLEIGLRTPPETLRRQINDGLPADINLLRIEPAGPRFHARHAAVARSYLYQICRRRSAFAKPYVWWVKDSLSVDAMTTAAAHFAGMHDFQSFSDDDPESKSTEVLVEDVDSGRSRRARAGARGRLALHLEDGAADRGRAGGGRRRPTRGRRGPWLADRGVRACPRA